MQYPLVDKYLKVEMKLISYIIMLTLLSVLCSCDNKASKIGDIVSSFEGKQLEIPNNLIYQILEDTITMDMKKYDYTIVTYIDSIGCTSCRLNPKKWDNVISHFKSLDDTDIGFVMIINSSDNRNIMNLLKNRNFLHPICFDTCDSFAKVNSIPQNEICNTFLLDSSYNIVLIGNPSINPKIMDLYNEVLSENNESFYSGNAIPFGVVESGGEVTKQFEISNSHDCLLTVKALVPSCECIEASITQEKIYQGNSAILSVQFNADTIVGPVKRYVDVFFNEKEKPERYTLYGFIH